MSDLTRRSLLRSLFIAAPAVILTPKLLMPVKALAVPSLEEVWVGGMDLEVRFTERISYGYVHEEALRQLQDMERRGVRWAEAV